MKAGKELDALIAERVFGYEAISFMGGYYSWRDKTGAMVPDARFSTDIRDAWEVVEKMREDGWRCQLTTLPATSLVCAEFNRYRWERWAFETASTMPLAICRAALKALGVSKD